MKARENKEFTVYDDHDIIVKLYDSQKSLIGQSRLDAALFR
jgi:hypothetical protein